MVQLGQAWVGLARELMKNSRASYSPCGQTDRQTDMLTERSIVDPTPSQAEGMRHEDKLKYKGKMWHAANQMNEFDRLVMRSAPRKGGFVCNVCKWVSKWRKSKPSTHLKTPEKRTGVQIHTHTHTRTYRDILLPDEVYLCCSQARREGEVELSDAAIRTTLSGRANKNEYFSPEISMGTYGGGLAHLQAHTHTHTYIDEYTAYHGCQNYSPPNHRCHNYHISIAA